MIYPILELILTFLRIIKINLLAENFTLHIKKFLFYFASLKATLHPAFSKLPEYLVFQCDLLYYLVFQCDLLYYLVFQSDSLYYLGVPI